MPRRDTIFLSHANPEDNRVTRWLALRLAREGYQTWSDLTGLLGGEDFWREAERIIRERATKFVYVLSRVSNTKPGPLKELHIAETVARREGLRDFIIPILIDDLPHSEINIQLARLNAIPFNTGWRSGVVALLKKLEQDGIPKSEHASPELVGSWWREHFNAEEGVLAIPEEYVSNWFAISELPRQIHLHELRAQLSADALAYPAVWVRPYLVSFAGLADLGGLNSDQVRTTWLCSTSAFRERGARGMSRLQARDILTQLVRVGWERFVTGRGLRLYELSGGARCAYFTTRLVGTDKVPFKGVDGKMSRRQLVGCRRRPRPDDLAEEVVQRYWHFAIQARPLFYPRLAYGIRTHVLFSSDGEEIWSSKARLHQARRSACRRWWNDVWRDRMLAAMSWLANGNETLRVPLSAGVSIEVSVQPLAFRSPVSYLEPEYNQPDDDDDAEDDEDDEHGEEPDESETHE